MVNNNSFLFGCVVVEAGRPSLKGFETEGEGVLSRRKTATLIDHHFALREHISGFIVRHSIVTICRCSDVFRPEIVVSIPLRLTIRYLHHLA